MYDRELNPTIDKICADNVSGLLEKKDRKEETINEAMENRIEDLYFSVTEYRNMARIRYL
jgi:hypothetical protein